MSDKAEVRQELEDVAELIGDFYRKLKAADIHAELADDLVRRFYDFYMAAQLTG